MNNSIVYTLLIALTGIGCAQVPETTSTPGDDASVPHELPVGVAFGKPEFKVVPLTVSCNGILDVPPQNRADVVAPLGGIVSSIQVYPTTPVTKGMLLAELSGEAYLTLQQDYLNALANLEFAEAEYARKRTLLEADATAERTFQEAERAVKQARAAEKGLSAKLRYCGINPSSLAKNGISETLRVLSPTNGYVTEVFANPGKSVDPNSPLLRIINKEHMHLELTVFEKDISAIKIDAPIRFKVQGSDEEYEGDVHLIGEELNTEIRSIMVHGHLSEEMPDLKPGMFVRAHIETTQDTVLTLPEEALLLRGNGYMVYEKNGDHAELTSIKIDRVNNSLAVISNPGKWKNKTVVVKGAYLMQDAEAGHEH
jgi:cobalt-zinc-cadmium efflux system membrane fusion protein